MRGLFALGIVLLLADSQCSHGQRFPIPSGKKAVDIGPIEVQQTGNGEARLRTATRGNRRRGIGRCAHRTGSTQCVARLRSTAASAPRCATRGRVDGHGPAKGHGKILVVEYDHLTRETFAMMLKPFRL